MKDYKSILFCFHPGHTDIYQNGLPLGIITSGGFTPHSYPQPDGTKRPVEIPDRFLPDLRDAVALVEFYQWLVTETEKKKNPGTG